jgi:hypothetical protein
MRTQLGAFCHFIYHSLISLGGVDAEKIPQLSREHMLQVLNHTAPVKREVELEQNGIFS